MKRWLFLLIGLVLGIALTILWGVLFQKTATAPTISDTVPVANTGATTNTKVNGTNANSTVNVGSNVNFSASDLPERDPHFAFTASLPASWTAEYQAASKAINFYDSSIDANNSLAGSEIFIQYYTASDFRRPSGVTLTSATVDGRAAKSYTAVLGTGAGKPTWAATKTEATDVKVNDQTPALYYSITKNPSLTAAQYQDFLKSVVLNQAPDQQ